MEIFGAARRTERTRRRRVRAEKIETAMIVALAGLVVIKGAPAVGMIAFAIAEMMVALVRA